MALSLLPMASLSLVTGTRTKSSISFCRAPSRSPLLHTSFLSTSLSLSFPSSFSGLSMGVDLRANTVRKEEGRRGLEVRSGKKYQLCQTKRSRSRKSLARTHGFRRRMRTTSGRAVLKRRRAKGRKFLCTKTNPNSGPRGG